MQISVRSNIKDVKRGLRNIHRRQIPFATSQALNDTAFLIRNDTVRVLWPRSVRVKARGFAKAAFRVEEATKRHLEAAVFDRLNRAFLPLQTDGGIKLPYSGTHIAIPTNNAFTAKGRFKKAAKLGNPKLFKMRLRNGRLGLWLRVETRSRRARNAGISSTLQLMYNLEKKSFVPKSFPFYEFGQRTVSVHFPRFLDRRLRRAIQTAR